MRHLVLCQHEGYSDSFHKYCQNHKHIDICLTYVVSLYDGFNVYLFGLTIRPSPKLVSSNCCVSRPGCRRSATTWRTSCWRSPGGGNSCRSSPGAPSAPALSEDTKFWNWGWVGRDTNLGITYQSDANNFGIVVIYWYILLAFFQGIESFSWAQDFEGVQDLVLRMQQPPVGAARHADEANQTDTGHYITWHLHDNTSHSMILH